MFIADRIDIPIFVFKQTEAAIDGIDGIIAVAAVASVHNLYVFSGLKPRCELRECAHAGLCLDVLAVAIDCKWRNAETLGNLGSLAT